MRPRTGFALVGLGVLIALGPAGYSLYMYVQYIIGAQYERYPGNDEYAFPLYLALIILSWSIGISAWRALMVAAVAGMVIMMTIRS